MYSFSNRWKTVEICLERSVHDLPVLGGTVNVHNVLKERKLTAVFNEVTASGPFPPNTTGNTGNQHN